MKYKEQEIGVPTLEMVKEYINKKKFVISPRKVYQKYVDNGWTTTKHQPILTLEAAINGCNSYPEKYSDIDVLTGGQTPCEVLSVSNRKVSRLKTSVEPTQSII